ncbi:L,D-transpeptidase family protein [Stakelama saccharophila]|uniref:L,D-transpeptidase family protein n=1 Tax=Stakelama saccharophila TaxID=3075605 RepID=A0ABZ0BCB8_9SPHN|nr:L,D-transpeptidase family protein [Stakelama sp. W311]WNO55003.1 L,D-transpeptidase family protein [Stakelama sp. W311]
MRGVLIAITTIALTAAGGVANAGTAPARPVAASPDKIDWTTLHVQVILDHLGFGPGVLDGRMGQSLHAALEGFQESRGLPETGEIDRATLRALHRYRAWRPTRTLTLSRKALAGPYVNPLPDDPKEQAKLQRLGYRSPMEKLAEMFHTTPEVLLELNSPQTMLTPGTKVVFPNALPTSRAYPQDLEPQWRDTLNMLNVEADVPTADHIVVDKSDGVLRVLDKRDRLLAQFSATMGSEHDPLPIGRWTIKGADYNPEFAYDPDLFWDADSSEGEAKLPPGPNGPVGVVWLDLSKEHYGIHGTPAPETIGRAESHGCIRLTNWDAARLSLMVKPGTPAIFQP